MVVWTCQQATMSALNKIAKGDTMIRGDKIELTMGVMEKNGGCYLHKERI